MPLELYPDKQHLMKWSILDAQGSFLQRREPTGFYRLLRFTFQTYVSNLISSKPRKLLFFQEGIDGHVTGVDMWDSKDQSQSSAVAALNNALREGVREYVEVKTADARELPFPNASFDLVVSSLCIHNIAEGTGR